MPTALYRTEQVQQLDRLITQEYGIAGRVLMERAGHALFEALLQHWPAAKRIAVVCGLGNNAGDGFVVARLAKLTGLKVQVLQVGDASRLTGDALAAATAWREYGGETHAFAAPLLAKAEVVVDALLGTGLDRPVQGEWYAAIEAMNQHPACIAIDIPSGLHADTGMALGLAVKAKVTVSFIGLKQGLFTAEAADYCGTIVFDTLQVPEAIYSRIKPASQRLNFDDIQSYLTPRLRSGHKGNYGHVLVIGGDYGYPGAVRLAAEAAARTGAGLVTVATRTAHVAAVVAARPELMCHGIEEAAALIPLLDKANVVIIGPGLGQDTWGQQLLTQVLAWDGKLIIDADGLNLLAQRPTIQANPNWVLTPHPGEAGRLLQSNTQAIQRDRFAAVQQLQQRYGGVIVLKGAGSLVQTQDPTLEPSLWLCDIGNPGMASGGMGDVLTGIIAGLSGQGLGLSQAARLGVYLHALAADTAANEHGERGLLASDLFAPLRQLLNRRNPSHNGDTANSD